MPPEGGRRGTEGPTHCARREAEADQQEDLGHKDGEGQVGVDVVALVPDGADRTEGGEAAVRPRPSASATTALPTTTPRAAQMLSLPALTPQWLPIALGKEPAPSTGFGPARPAPCFPLPAPALTQPVPCSLSRSQCPILAHKHPSPLQAAALTPAMPPWERTSAGLEVCAPAPHHHHSHLPYSVSCPLSCLPACLWWAS